MIGDFTNSVFFYSYAVIVWKQKSLKYTEIVEWTSREILLLGVNLRVFEILDICFLFFVQFLQARTKCPLPVTLLSQA